MKKTFQVVRNVAIPANSSKVVTVRLKEEYKNCVGFFLAPSAALTDFGNLTLGLSIAQIEILPHGTDATLFAINETNSWKDVMYDFEEEGIPAKSSTVELTMENKGTAQTFQVYFLLKN